MKELPRIWGMILGGTGMTELKKQCFANNEIRLGWSEVDDDDVDCDFVGDEKASWNAKHMVSDFKNTMEIGDIVVIEKNIKSIDDDCFEDCDLSQLTVYAPGGSFLPCIGSLECLNAWVTPVVIDECNKYGAEWLARQK